MNYLKELNAFYDRLETNPLSIGAVSLWHALMQVNNRARWKKKFTVAMAVLCYKARLSESSFKRARKELFEMGYIHYESQRGNQAAIYEILSLEFHTEEYHYPHQSSDIPNQETQPSQDAEDLDDNLDRNPGHHLDHNLDPKPDTLMKQNKNKTKQESTYAVNDDSNQLEAFQFYLNHFGKLNGYMKDELTKLIHDLGEDLILHAMKRTLKRGKTNWGYAKAILKAWKEKGITTIEEADLEEVRFQKMQQRPRQSSQTMHTHIEPVPDWFYQHKREQQEKLEMELNKQSTKDNQKLIEEVKRRSQAYA